MRDKINVGVVGCLHGNEIVGKRVIDRLKKMKLPRNIRIKTIIANRAAIRKRKRFLQSDLNRSFPGLKNGTHEERLAIKIIKRLRDCDYIIDIHSTFARMDSSIITTQKTFRRKEVSGLVRKVPLEKVLVMGTRIGKGKSLIDSVTAGVSIEFSSTVSAPKAFEIVRKTIENISSGSEFQGNKETFTVLRFLDRKKGDVTKMKNFSLVKKGKAFMTRDGKPVLAVSDFYPVFLSEKGYTGKICMIARKV